MKAFLLSLIYQFPKQLKCIYPYYEVCYKAESKYCVDLWRDKDWDAGGIVPMLRKGRQVAYYRITRAYYTMGGSYSDWAYGDDGKSRDMQLHHVEAPHSFVCLLGLHTWRVDFKHTPILDQSDPYASAGSLRIGITRSCSICKREEACGITNELPTFRWEKVMGRTALEERIPRSPGVTALIAANTPIVKTFKE
jgi:hypothetical protein